MKYSNHIFTIMMLASVLYGCSDSDHPKASCNPDAVPSTRSTVDETGCISVNLSNPLISNNLVSIEEDKDELVIKLKTDSAVCLSLSGSRDGGVKIKNSNNVDVDLVLNQVTITSNSKPGYLKLSTGNDNWGNTYLVKLVGTSSITGASSAESKKVLSAEPNLSFTGDGTLNIIAKYKTGIGCDDVVTVYNGNINITLDRTDAAKTSGYEENGLVLKLSTALS
ncbi:MAG: carbohydrate-binding domain-containing protein [Proteobacteria bacterium]|nr:carbohydrate-binding domain-containing protein [Pseudomonadota bacterium]